MLFFACSQLHIVPAIPASRAQRYTMEADAAQQQYQEKVGRSHEVQQQLDDATAAAALAKQVTGFFCVQQWPCDRRRLHAQHLLQTQKRET